MIHAHPSTSARGMPRLNPAPALPQAYCPVPQSLIADLHDTPLAIGLYTLVARLYLVHQAPIPLSRADVMRYDPTLKAGAVKRAFDRLIDRSWLIAAAQEGHPKQRYTPSWGRVKGQALAWQMDAPCLGRPRHIIRLGVDRSLLDICMGKLTPHATQAGTITRYVTTPALSLADVGAYALMLADIPHETPGLRWLGVIRNGQALPLPAEERLLAIISQRSLTLGDPTSDCQPELTASGTRRLGVRLPASSPQSSQPLFFVPPGLIGSQIGSLIGSQIGQGSAGIDAPDAPVSHEIRSDVRPAGITWEDREQAKQASFPHMPPAAEHSEAGAGGTVDSDSLEKNTRRARAKKRQKPAETPIIPQNETTQLLQAINILPQQQIELAELPAATVKMAIADGKARPEIRDLAGWVVKLLRNHRDYGFNPQPIPANSQSPEALRAAFAQLAAQQEAARSAEPPYEHQAPRPSADWANREPDAAHTHPPAALSELWDAVQAALRSRIPRAEFNTWLRCVSLRSSADGVATLVAPSALVKRAIEDRYLGLLREQLAQQAGEALEPRVILAPAPNLQSAICNLQSPAWISAARWAALPALIRAALHGSTIVDDQVRYASLGQARSVEKCYAAAVAALLADCDRG